jgi:hypothetical protein
MCDICELSFNTRLWYKEHRNKCVRQKESLRVTCLHSILPYQSCHNSGDFRRTNPLASDTPIIPIDQSPHDILGTSQSSLPLSWWLLGLDVGNEN